MKKLIYVTVFTVSGLVMVSCDADSVDGLTNKATSKKNKYEVSSLTLKEGDTISVNDTLITNIIEEPGPGDEVVPVKPPKP